MKHIITVIAIIFLVSCSGNQGKTGAESVAADSAATVTAPPDSLSVHAMILWKASQGMPLFESEIDSVIAYFDSADRWTGRNIAAIRSQADFDSLEARYLRAYPYMEAFSAILEQYAVQISSAQMERLQATAISMGAKVDSAAKRAGIDPATVNPLHEP